MEIEAVRELWVSDAEKFVSALKLSTLPLSRSAAFRNGSEKKHENCFVTTKSIGFN